MRFVIRRVAAAEALRARWWYAAFSEEAEASFSAALEAAFSLIRANPASGAPSFDDFRRVLVSGYPYAVIYRLSGNELLVVAVAHTSRKPGYWQARR